MSTVYDAFGQLAAEYSTVPQDPPCQTCYLSYDQRGDVRMVTDQSGNVVARHDYLPFGTEVPANIAGRNSQWGSTSDVEQKFTGQIRDQETGMDFFSARYYGSAFGRFTSPDPANAGADPMNPQTWDAYAYVGNNPLTVTDPSGMAVIIFNPMPNLQNFGTDSGFGGSNGGLGIFNGSGIGPANGGIPYQIGDQTDSEYEPSLTPTSSESCGGLLNICSAQTSPSTNLIPPPTDPGPTPNPGPGPGSGSGPGTGSGSPGNSSTGSSGTNPTTGTRGAGANSWDWCSLRCASVLSWTSNFSAGAADFLSFGLTTRFNTWTGAQSAVDPNSSAYTAGQFTGVGITVAGGALEAGKAFAGLETKIAIHDAHHTSLSSVAYRTCRSCGGSRE